MLPYRCETAVYSHCVNYIFLICWCLGKNKTFCTVLYFPWEKKWQFAYINTQQYPGLCLIEVQRVRESQKLRAKTRNWIIICCEVLWNLLLSRLILSEAYAQIETVLMETQWRNLKLCKIRSSLQCFVIVLRTACVQTNIFLHSRSAKIVV
jgi:hypothetical protein